MPLADVLERLTEPSDLVEADEGAGERGEGPVDVGAAFVADGQAPEADQPGQGPFHDPTVAPEAVGALDAAARDAGRDGAGAALGAASAVVVGLVCVELFGPASRPSTAAAHARDDVEHRGQHLAVVPVGPAQLEAERRAAGIDDEVALRARPSAVRGVRADLCRGRRPPPFAGMDALSIEARPQSNASAAASRSRRTRCRAPSTPAACQSRSRRQQVMPVQPKTSRGSRSQPMPDHSTNTMPSRARRSSQRGRPPFGLGGSSGSRGSTAAHSSSLTRGLLMTPNAERSRRFC